MRDKFTAIVTYCIGDLFVKHILDRKISHM